MEFRRILLRVGTRQRRTPSPRYWRRQPPPERPLLPQAQEPPPPDPDSLPKSGLRSATASKEPELEIYPPTTVEHPVRSSTCDFRPWTFDRAKGIPKLHVRHLHPSTSKPWSPSSLPGRPDPRRRARPRLVQPSPESLRIRPRLLRPKPGLETRGNPPR